MFTASTGTKWAMIAGSSCFRGSPEFKSCRTLVNWPKWIASCRPVGILNPDISWYICFIWFFCYSHLLRPTSLYVKDTTEGILKSKQCALERQRFGGLSIRLARPINISLKVARYSFSGSIPPKFERKLRRHKQRFGKINTTVVLDKDENLLWSGL